MLLIEDDVVMGEYLLKGLTASGHLVEWIGNGLEGLGSALSGEYDVIVVDRMVPGVDGLTVVKTMRAAAVFTPVLFLTSMSGVHDRVDGLEAGGDDYLVKPFAFSELSARVNALARRPPITAEKTILSIDDLSLDLLTRSVTRAGVCINLLPREFQILELFMRNEGRVLTKNMLLERVWNFNFDPQSSVVETHISRLRTKIDRPFVFPLLHTVRNIGYSMHARR